MSYKAETIEDLEKLFYTPIGHSILDDNYFKKDAPLISTTTGVYNAVYGVRAWIQLNMEANTFASMPKLPWTRSGWRVVTARGNAGAPTGGTAENAGLPATTKPTFVEVTTTPKTSAKTFDNSETQEFLAKNSSDDAYGSMDDLRAIMASEFKEDLNLQLNTGSGTLASNNFESMDRVCGSHDEIANSKESDESTSYTANDIDIYSQDRDSADSWVDAYVSYSATSGSVRSMTDAILQGVLNNTLKNGANRQGQHIQTGWDTWSAINQLYDSQVRYNVLGTAKISPGMNGVKSSPGRDVGLEVASWNGTPIIESKNTVVDTGGISRFYLLDTSNPEGMDYPRLFLKVAKPVQYFEAGMAQGTPFVTDRFGTEGMHRIMGEIICSFFAAQGKGRDLKA